MLGGEEQGGLGHGEGQLGGVKVGQPWWGRQGGCEGSRGRSLPTLTNQPFL